MRDNQNSPGLRGNCDGNPGERESNPGFSGVSEKFIQWLWSRQQFRRTEMVTTDGERIEVLHPGYWNRGPGPDFRRAVLRFGIHPPVTGDVEVEISPSGWKKHGHCDDFHFSHVVLLVVWKVDGPLRLNRHMKVLELSPHLTCGIETRDLWMGHMEMDEVTLFDIGRCREGFCSFPPDLSRDVLESAGINRLRHRARSFKAWAHEWGWDKSLILGLVTALGMPSNGWPMRYVCEKIFQNLRHQPVVPSWMEAQALALGIGNWLPGDSISGGSLVGPYLKEIWDIWWRMHNLHADDRVPRSVWNLRQCRPLNHPQRRLVLAAYWLGMPAISDSILRWVQAEPAGSGSQLISAIHKILQPPASDFWENYFSLNHVRAIGKPTSLLGRCQMIDLGVNAIFPWVIAWGQDQDIGMSRKVEALARRWPGSQENKRTRHLRLRLFGSGTAGPKCGSLVQQGLLQIEMEYCRLSNSLCARCPMPMQLRSIRQSTENS